MDFIKEIEKNFKKKLKKSLKMQPGDVRETLQIQ